MPRERKFKVWDKENKEWIELTGDTFLCYSNEKFEVIEGDEHYAATIKKVEIVEFTGLIDKNGTEIYESDIVKLPLCKDDIATFEGGCPNYRLRGGSGYYELGNCNPYCFEVIGNIFENPELIGR